MNNECNYVYRITHVLTGQHYVGSRKSRGLPAEQDLGKRYFTSSKDVRSLFRTAPHDFRIMSPETREKIRQAMMGNRNSQRKVCCA